MHSKPQYDILKDENNSIDYINHIGDFNNLSFEKIYKVSNLIKQTALSFSKIKTFLKV